MWDKFTERAKRIVYHAQEEARAFGRAEVSADDIVLGALRGDDGVIDSALRSIGMSAEEIDRIIRGQLHTGAPIWTAGNDMVLSSNGKLAIDCAYKEALQASAGNMTSDYLFLGALQAAETLKADYLAGRGVNVDVLRPLVVSARLSIGPEGPIQDPVWPPAPSTVNRRSLSGAVEISRALKSAITCLRIARGIYLAYFVVWMAMTFTSLSLIVAPWRRMVSPIVVGLIEIIAFAGLMFALDASRSDPNRRAGVKMSWHVVRFMVLIGIIGYFFLR